MADRLRKARPPRDPSAIPAELREIPRWVVWDFFPPKPPPAKQKLGKAPLAAGKDFKADYTHPSAWRSFDAVLEESRRRGDVGVGFVFDSADDVVGVDLDDAYSPSGELKAWAKEIFDRFPTTWAEKSVSGTGIHLLGRGDPIAGEKRRAFSGDEGVERYSERRFFTVSGDVLRTAGLEDIRSGLAWLDARHFRRPEAAPKPAAGSRGDDPEFDLELARVCLGYLKDSRAHDSDDWRRVGMALKATSEELAADWLAFSKRWPEFSKECSEEECRDRWRRFKPREIGLGSLIFMAVQDSGKPAVDLSREAKIRLGRELSEIDLEERLKAARYGVEESGVLSLVLASDPTLSAYREIGLGLAGDLVAVPEISRHEWARISKAFPGARVQLLAGDLGDEAFRSSCRSLLGCRGAPEAVVVVGPETWEGRDDLPSWLDDKGLPDAGAVIAEKARPPAAWVADDLLARVSPEAPDTLRRETVDRVLDAAAECRGGRAALDVEDLLHRCSEATGYSRESLEALIGKARERAEEGRLRDRIGKELSRIAESAGDPREDPTRLLETARETVAELSSRSAVVAIPRPFDVAELEAEAKLVKAGFSTGWGQFADVRLRPKEFVGVAARPGQGKTSVLVWLAWQILEQVDDGVVVFVSHEETRLSILYRLFSLASAVLAPKEKELSRNALVSLRWNKAHVRDWLAGGSERAFSKEKIAHLGRARELVVERARRLIVVEERGAGADRVAKLCRAVHDAHGCRGVLLDYLQKLPHDGPEVGKGRRDMETAWACRRLREGVAIPFECPVVTAAQVNREGLRDGWQRRILEALDPAKKPRGKPRAGDDDDSSLEKRIRNVERVLAEARPAPHMLRDGGIEHEADLIIGTHNPSADMAWDREKRAEFVREAWPWNPTPLDVGVLKNRSGEDGDWIRLVGDYGAGYFVDEPGEDPVGAIPADEWQPDENPYP